jgi:hypothetical protein
VTDDEEDAVAEDVSVIEESIKDNDTHQVDKVNCNMAHQNSVFD